MCVYEHICVFVSICVHMIEHVYKHMYTHEHICVFMSIYVDICYLSEHPFAFVFVLFEPRNEVTADLLEHTT